jgi:hypothetical protein
MPDHPPTRSPSPRPAAVLAAAAFTGTVASLVSAGVLALFARGEGRGPLQPLNATSHWLHGPDAGRRRGADLAHTGTGFATHHASSVFWALPLEWWLATREEPDLLDVAGGAAAVAATAAAVDYGLVPRRITPGWEHAVSPAGVAAGIAGLGLGLAAGALLGRALSRG